MADGISIPSQFEFKELLSHTFPGFFSAISIFMLMDLWTDKDLTTWVIGGNFAGLVTFIGFVLLMGTILGVIIDGIHHSIIEDDIFDNLKAVQEIKSVFAARYGQICSNNSKKYLTRHYFYPSIGEDKKGDKAIAIDEHLEKGYYRYSEFYANIFLSLILFALISPFYLSEVLKLSWMHSIIIGIISLSVACICLNSSYTAYRAYLRAQMSVICGFISRCPTNACSNKAECNKSPPTEINKPIKLIWICTIIYLAILLVVRLFLVERLDIADIWIYIIAILGWYVVIIFLLYIFGYRTYIKERNQDNLITKLRNFLSQYALDLTISALNALFVILIALGISDVPPQDPSIGSNIAADPQSIALNLTYGEVTHGYIETISIKNIGKNQINITPKYEGSIDNLVLPSHFILLDANETDFINITVKNDKPLYGKYKGLINITYSNNNTNIKNISVDIKVTEPAYNECEMLGLFEFK